MFKSLLFPKRFLLLRAFASTYLIFSFIIRFILYAVSINEIDFSIANLFKLFAVGFFFDIGSISYLLVPYTIYLTVLPSNFTGRKLDKWITNFFYFLFLFLLVFSFLSEITFWSEYQRRFNFIAVDYLLYTFEVIGNINESYPIPILVFIIILITCICILVVKRKNIFDKTFSNKTPFIYKLIPAMLIALITFGFHYSIDNKDAEIFKNRFENELAKSGLYSFFAAYKSNELSYDEFYAKIDRDVAFRLVRKINSVQGDSLTKNKYSIRRTVFNKGIELKPNIVFIGLESMNADFMTRFGNQENLTPTIDSLFNNSIAYSNLYATGTRTIRGLEAITLAIPPTPGRSIIKRPKKTPLYTIGNILKEKKYTRTFFYGGDSYFDNLNNYFSSNGFDIVDRKNKYRIDKKYATKRTNIDDDEVTFENAWGACDEDIYNKLIKVADQQFQTGRPFFNFVMNNSNHQPYTYPNGLIDIPSGTNRQGAIKYADFALKNFFEKAKKKPWYKNTVFILMSDHCAYSAGRSEINVKKYHIPAMILNLPNQKNSIVDKLCSQMDVLPTLFGYLNWTYTSNSYGQDIRKTAKQNERAFIANYRKLGLLKKDTLTVLNSKANVSQYLWNKHKNKTTAIDRDTKTYHETISYYQTAYDLYKNGGLDDFTK